jgi:hypothetical protein
LAVVAAAAFGVYTANKDIAGAQMSDLQVENVEALAQDETSQSFYERTGCEATTENIVCKGKDGKRYSFAYRP